MAAILNVSLNPADYDYATANIGFKLETKKTKSGAETTTYRAYNLVERTVLGTKIKPGLVGGTVDNPEVLTDDNFWFNRDSELYGNTIIEGEALLRNCKIYNSIIKDGTKIGCDKKDAKTYRLDSLYQEPVTVKIIDSIIDPEDESITIEGTAYIKKCVVKGECFITDHAHLIECDIKDAFIYDHAYVYKSKLNIVGFDTSVQIINCDLTNVDATGEVVIENRKFSDERFGGSFYYNETGRKQSYEYITNYVA